MFNNIFKKEAPTNGTPEQANGLNGKKENAIKPADNIDWQAILDAAQTDDAALLALAMQKAPQKAPLKIRLAAIEAMQTEEGLKAAEREFREHDRSIHREAKRRFEQMQATRTARADADKLIESLRQLSTQENIPVNHFVNLDREWDALNPELLTSSQTVDYRTLADSIAQTLRARGDQQLTIKRWTHDAERALLELQAGSLAVAETGLERDKLGIAYEAVNQLHAETPQFLADEAVSRDVRHRQTQLESALIVARALDARLNFLDTLLTDAAHDQATIAAWNALPVVAESKVAALLQTRFDVLRKSRDDAVSLAKRAARAETVQHNKAERDTKIADLDKQLLAAETALGGGHIVEASTILAAIEAVQKTAKPALNLNSKMQNRISALRAEITRLKGWQHWGGGRVREDLVGEAEVLSRAITDEKLNVRAHADAIEALRERWKELDKLGGATNRELWTNFDAALKTAFLPVSAMQAKMKAQRQENLTARNALISTLDAYILPNAIAETKPDYRELARVIEHFQAEWRKLGPLEHTVPHKVQESLLARMKAAVARLDAPLHDARRIESMKREKLIAQAAALSVNSPQRDTINKVRELQAEWQQHAKSLPLARQVENKLWAQFKAATDAVFQARDAANAARDATLLAGAGERDALIAKLQALNADSTPADIRRTLNEVDQAWRRTGEAPRATAAKIEQRYRNARDAAQQFAAGSAKRVWLKSHDALLAKLAICNDAEAGNSVNADVNWQAQSTTDWDKTLHARLADALAGKARAPVNRDDLLLKLESALDIESPPPFQAARRELKLRAMKAAIEARQAVAVTDADIKSWIGEVIGAKMPETQASMRLSVILSALRERPLR